MKKAFTLAEVLITLAVIGVVAALTIPVVVHNYQKHQFYSKFMKSYNTIQKAYQLSMVDNGTVNDWDVTEEEFNDREAVFNKFFGRYLNVAAFCTNNPGACGINQDTTINYLNFSGPGDDGGSSGSSGGSSSSGEWSSSSGEGSSSSGEGSSGGSGSGEEEEYALPSYYDLVTQTVGAALLQDGSIVIIMGIDDDHDGICRESEILFDVNGAKGPNTLGRDIYMVNAGGCADNGNDKKVLPEGARAGLTLDDVTNSADFGNICSSSRNSTGLTCGLRLLLEGKMNY